MLPVFFSLQKSFSLNSEWFLGRVSLVRVFSFPFQHFKYLLPLPSDLQNFCWKLRPYGFPFYVILIFLLLPIKLSLQILQFQLWSILGGGLHFGFISVYSSCSLDLDICFLLQVKKVYSHMVIKYISRLLLSVFSFYFPYNANVTALDVEPQVP